MYDKPFSKVLFVVLAFVIVYAMPSQAQNAQSSNSTMTVITSSDAVGGAFSQDVEFGLKAHFANADVQANVNAVAATLNAQLAQGVFLFEPLASASNEVSHSFAAQQSMFCVLMQADAGCEGQVSGSLATIHGSQKLSRALVERVAGLTENGEVTATQLVRSIRAMNKMVQKAPESFLVNPPDEFRVIHKTLTMLVEAATMPTP